MYECTKRVGRNDCENCVLYDEEMGKCLNDIKAIEQKYKCEHCKDTGYVQIAPYVRGLKMCPYCSESKNLNNLKKQHHV